ncbi:MAG: glucose 1-dehydrogenase [Burkholderiaceae bacterium]|nr:glucose 1-dehydrogenase [Burkholderiaceae bacterium]
MFDDLRGRVVLITGAGTGIGAAAARAFGRAGANVVVHYRASEAPAARVVADIRAGGGEAVALQADLTVGGAREQLVRETLGHFGRIDVLVNNAGDLVRRAPVAEGDDALLDAVIELNVRAVVALCRLVIPVMQRQGCGNIINVSSVAARTGGGPGAVLYAAAKGFVSTFTRGLAKELAPQNIRVNAVAPGVIVTPFQERHTTAAQLQAFRAGIPMGRLGAPEDCAGAFLYLASDAASGYVTGQILEVNGGQLMP